MHAGDQIKLFDACRELFRLYPTSNLYKAVSLCQIFHNAPKQVSKHYVLPCSFRFGALNACKKWHQKSFHGCWRAPGTKDRISVRMAAGGTSSLARRVALRSLQLENLCFPHYVSYRAAEQHRVLLVDHSCTGLRPLLAASPTQCCPSLSSHSFFCWRTSSLIELRLSSLVTRTGSASPVQFPFVAIFKGAYGLKSVNIWLKCTIVVWSSSPPNDLTTPKKRWGEKKKKKN